MAVIHLSIHCGSVAAVAFSQSLVLSPPLLLCFNASAWISLWGTFFPFRIKILLHFIFYWFQFHFNFILLTAIRDKLSHITFDLFFPFPLPLPSIHSFVLRFARSSFCLCKRSSFAPFLLVLFPVCDFNNFCWKLRDKSMCIHELNCITMNTNSGHNSPTRAVILTLLSIRGVPLTITALRLKSMKFFTSAANSRKRMMPSFRLTSTSFSLKRCKDKKKTKQNIIKCSQILHTFMIEIFLKWILRKNYLH